MSALLGYLLLFVVVGAGFVLIHLLLGMLLRPRKPHAEKLTIYECGEPTIGTSFIQFDLRFYVVALLFVIFDVEVAFFFPWAVVFGKANTLASEHVPAETRQAVAEELFQQRDWRTGEPKPVATPSPKAAGQLAWLAFFDILIFFGVLIVGFAYLWRRGDLNWVRSLAAERAAAPRVPLPQAPAEPVLAGAGR